MKEYVNKLESKVSPDRESDYKKLFEDSNEVCELI